MEFTPPDRAPFTLRPAPPGVTGQWPEGFGSPVHLLSAWDPGLQRPGDTVNRVRQAELEDELAQRGLEMCPTAGRVPGSARQEVGVAVCGLTLPDAITFGTRFGQDAIFEWTPAALSTISCVDARRHDGGWVIAGGT